MAFTRWDPLRDLLALHEQLGHLVGSDAPGWTPPVDLFETADEYVLTAELPGLTREQIDIHAEERRIVIRGARGADPGRDIPCEQYHRVERGHGRFSRAFSLPEIIDVDAHHRRSQGRHPDDHDPQGARSRHAADRRQLTAPPCSDA